MKQIANETNKYEQQEILKTSGPLTFCSRIRKWENVIVDEVYVVVAMFMLMGIVRKPTLRSCYSKNCLLFTVFWGCGRGGGLCHWKGWS
jgi:hypothetical protein